jgi:hypothetical protein
MAILQIKEFSLSTTVDRAQAALYNETEIREIAQAVCKSSFAEYCVPSEIALGKENELYSYELVVPLFNRMASITFGPIDVAVVFKRGTTQNDLNLMIAVTLEALEIGKLQPAKRNALSFAAHAVFETQVAYDAHMNKFLSLSGGVKSGGTILVVDLPEGLGQMRYASEQSLTHPHGIFLAVTAHPPGAINKETYSTLAACLKTVAALEGFIFAEQ